MGSTLLRSTRCACHSCSLCPQLRRKSACLSLPPSVCIFLLPSTRSRLSLQACQPLRDRGGLRGFLSWQTNPLPPRLLYLFILVVWMSMCSCPHQLLIHSGGGEGGGGRGERQYHLPKAHWEGGLQSVFSLPPPLACVQSHELKCVKCKEGLPVVVIRAGDAFCR